MWLWQVGGTSRTIKKPTPYIKQKYGMSHGLGYWITFKCCVLIGLISNSTVFASQILFIEVFQTMSTRIKKWPFGYGADSVWIKLNCTSALLHPVLMLTCQAEASLWSEAGYVCSATALHAIKVSEQGWLSFCQFRVSCLSLHLQVFPKCLEMQPSMHGDLESTRTPCCCWIENRWKALWKIPLRAYLQV